MHSKLPTPKGWITWLVREHVYIHSLLRVITRLNPKSRVRSRSTGSRLDWISTNQPCHPRKKSKCAWIDRNLNYVPLHYRPVALLLSHLRLLMMSLFVSHCSRAFRVIHTEVINSMIRIISVLAEDMINILFYCSNVQTKLVVQIMMAAHLFTLPALLATWHWSGCF